MMMNCLLGGGASSCLCSSGDEDADPAYFGCFDVAVALLMALKCSCEMLLLRVGPSESSIVMVGGGGRWMVDDFTAVDGAARIVRAECACLGVCECVCVKVLVIGGGVHCSSTRREMIYCSADR